MKIVLLGPNGQLGTDIRAIYETSGKGDEVIPIGRDRLDVTDGEALHRILSETDFDVVINCTSYHKTDEVEDNATKAFAVNAHAVQEIARICAAKGASTSPMALDAP